MPLNGVTAIRPLRGLQLGPFIRERPLLFTKDARVAADALLRWLVYMLARVVSDAVMRTKTALMMMGLTMAASGLARDAFVGIHGGPSHTNSHSLGTRWSGCPVWPGV